MTSLLALALASAQYGFEPGAKHDYQMTAIFDGFLPILGGNTGKAEISMGLTVTGEAKSASEVKAASEITSFSMKFNEAPLPFGLEMVQDFFPRAVVTLTPQGKITGNTAPDKDLPVRLPGLDPKRMPDITFVPIEFPDKGLNVGDVWKFEKPFAGAPIAYTCRLEKVEGDIAQVSVNVKQVLAFLESDAIEVVKKEEDAASSVRTEMLGSGRVWFDTVKGIAVGSKMQNTAISKVTPLKQGKPTERKMVTTLSVSRAGFQIPKVEEAGPKVSAPSSESKGSMISTAAAVANESWTWIKEKAQSGLNTLQAWRMMAATLASQVPFLSWDAAGSVIKDWMQNWLGPRLVHRGS